MKRVLAAILALAFLRSLSCFGQTSVFEPADGRDGTATESNAQPLGRLTFESNVGQFEPSVAYRARSGRTVFDIHLDGHTMCWTTDEGNERLRWRFSGQAGAPQSRLIRTSGRANYLRGSSRKDWIMDAPLGEEVRITDALRGIDIEYHAKNGGLEYDLHVAPAVDVTELRVHCEGGTLSLKSPRELIVRRGDVEFTQELPAAWEVDDDGTRHPVEAAYILHDESTFGFDVERVDPKRTLVIDPALIFVRLFGGSLNDVSYGCAADGLGGSYISATGFSPDFQPGATPGASDPNPPNGGSLDVCLAHLDRSGTITWLTFFKGSGTEGLPAMATQGGFVYAAGRSGSTFAPGTFNDFGDVNTTGGVTTAGDSAMVVLFDPSAVGAAQVVAGARLGGMGAEDQVNEIRIASNGDVILAGWTNSQSGFPYTTGAYLTAPQGDLDGFVARLSANLNSLIWVSGFGGPARDALFKMTLDGNGDVILVGGTDSMTFPQTSGIATTIGTPAAPDVFVARMLANGSGLTRLTRVCASGNDQAMAVAVDNVGRVIVGGFSYSTNFPLLNAFDISRDAPSDGFVIRLDPTLTTWDYGTYFGGAGDDTVTELAVDAQGIITLAGYVSAPGFTGPSGSYLPTYHGGLNDGFVARLDPTLSGSAQLRWMSYIGGAGDEEILDMAVDANGEVVVSGLTNSATFPTGGAATRGSNDAFLVRMRFVPTHVGQANSPLASLRVNDHGQGSVPGPFCVYLHDGTTLRLDWTAAPGAPLILLSSLNPIAAGGTPVVWPIGIIELGNPPGCLSSISIAADGTQPGFPNFLFVANGAGTAQQTFSLPAGLTGMIFSLQGIVVVPLNPMMPSCGVTFQLTAGFEITIV